MHALDKVNELKAELKKLQPISTKDQQELNKKFRLEFSYNSNHLEGNTLTYSETELLLIFEDTKGGHTIREYDEMRAHDAAYQLINEWAKDKERPLTEQSIKNLNEIILVKPFWKEAITPDGQPTRRLIKIGDYKEQPNSVRLASGELFEYTSPQDTPIQMGELISWYRSEENAIHPVTLAAMLHYKFVRIHPFDDGNGRIARLLMNYVFLRNDLPPVIIKSADKGNYLKALHLADVGDYEPFIEYVADQLIWSLQINIKAAKGEDIEEADDIKKEINLLTRKFNAENKQSKYPAIVYEIFGSFSKEVWREIKKALTEFEGLFAEYKEFHFVNHSPESFEKKNAFESPLLVSTGPRKIKIFGHDIYEHDIEFVEWQLKLYGLKGVKEKPELEIRSLLKFNVDKYHVKILVGYISIFESDYFYGDQILKDDIEKMLTSLAKQVLGVIKDRIE